MNGLPQPLWELRFVFLGAFFIAVSIEIVIRVLRHLQPTRPALILVNSGMWLVELSLRGATYAWRLTVFSAVAAFAPLTLSSGLPTWVLAYVAVDFVYYWKHRLLHRTSWGWALHAPHHSSDELTLLAAIRLGWLQRLIDDFFFLPLVLLGFHPVLLLLVVLLNEVYPSWCHVSVVGPLGVIDRILNTPENHRAHHALDRALCDSNYASTFIIWDRLFGTWRSGSGVTKFGISDAPMSLNPLTIQLAPMWRWLRRSPPV